MQGFEIRDATLAVENVPLATIADRVGTPVYVYSAGAIRERYRALADALAPHGATIHYAVKANSNQAVITLLRELGAGADVVSGGELTRALAAGVPADRIVFAGVGKTREEMAAAIDAGIHLFNIESEPELETLAEVARSKGTTARVGLRVNPDVDARTHAKITTGKAENKFGVPIERAPAFFARAAATEGVEAIGLSAHIGSQLLDLAPYRQTYVRLREMTLALRSEGYGPRLLDLGEGFARRYYAAWGFGGHWDGHAGCQNHLVFPYWIVSALQWATDTRDPYSSSHGYVQNVMRHAPFGSSPSALTWDQLRAIGERVYGAAEAVDPRGAYRAKAFPAYYHARRSVMKDSVPTDDQVFPLIYSVTTEDRFFRVGDIEGPDIDSHLFRLGTATEWEPVDLDQAAERVYTLERALCVRHWGRDREMDLTALQAFEYEENWASPMLGRRYALDREQFLPVLDEYYGCLGWDPDTGWPTPERLVELGLDDVYGPMVSDAERARVERAPWPEEPPVNNANDPIHARDRSPALPGGSA